MGKKPNVSPPHLPSSKFPNSDWVAAEPKTRALLSPTTPSKFSNSDSVAAPQNQKPSSKKFDWASLPGLGIKADAASGIDVHEECKLKFLELKTKRTYRSVVFKIEEEQKQVIVEATGDPTETYEAFTDSLPTDECCYAVFDFDLPIPEGVPKRQILFIAWSPDTSREGNKKIYASAIDSVKRELDGIQIELAATGPSEISLDVIRNRVAKYEP